MRHSRSLLWVLAFAAFTSAPAHATSVTVVMSGEWTQIDDTAGVTDGSISLGGAFTFTLTYDDATPDSDPSSASGLYLFAAATSALTISTGNYTFTLNPSESIELGIENNLSGQDDFGLFAENFTTSGPLPLGVTTGYGYTNPFVADSTQTAHSSDDLTGLPWDASAYDSPNNGMYFIIAVNGAGPNQFIELVGDFTDFTVLPEASSLTMLALGLLAVARVRRG